MSGDKTTTTYARTLGGPVVACELLTVYVQPAHGVAACVNSGDAGTARALVRMAHKCGFCYAFEYFEREHTRSEPPAPARQPKTIARWVSGEMLHTLIVKRARWRNPNEAPGTFAASVARCKGYEYAIGWYMRRTRRGERPIEWRYY